ncbi:hypothetical protein [Rhodospirillum rubrum]|uniref:Uncharacterized protein n=1 Tax=Rhodospirillum rubrum (strain ATCC 11170 / ATH 1.1.1 / DSM 467 / LMG 4362 / NCIMB 8255 / S1) TaxID=269796 RepID=Q2RX12_RHORT|nr:hypothetical protein [Rhodospirillum rubrum]ABC21333.1 hypothetical protein Rru_A0529 [Rhodospirillum rubrum ATCC 11170]AEO47013.1 hypothetical protein F11_02715 [Rhodospirillum rubrum F11]MBK5952892.1 hypothetical protein [Rhodospirillum rubrum]QXG81014.1 hypothetical protein KUL73_02765 [Rhodospirillum rubrum]
MDPLARRDGLLTRPNPAPRHDYLVILDGRPRVDLPGLTDPLLVVRLVPDRLLIDGPAFAGYIAGLGRWSWPGPEDLTLAVLDDINNEVVPRWVQVEVRASQTAGRSDDHDQPANRVAGLPHRVIAEDRQPLWRGRPPLSIGES